MSNPIEELRMLPDQLKLGQTSKVRFAIQKVLDYVEAKEKTMRLVTRSLEDDIILSVLRMAKEKNRIQYVRYLRDLKKEDVLLIELNYMLSPEAKEKAAKELSEKVGCKVVILNRGTEAKLLLEDTSVFKEKKNSHIVIKREDVQTLISADEALALANILQKIEDKRYELGKKIQSSYYVVNLDEPYAKEVFEVIKKGEIIKNE